MHRSGIEWKGFPSTGAVVWDTENFSWIPVDLLEGTSEPAHDADVTSGKIFLKILKKI